MKRTIAALLAIACLSSCASDNPTQPVVLWQDCARSQALAWMESGVPAAWPTTASIPSDGSSQVVPLGAFPPEATSDALYRTLHLVPSKNAIYVEQSGGVAGVHQLYGPVSLAGRCPAPALGAP